MTSSNRPALSAPPPLTCAQNSSRSGAHSNLGSSGCDLGASPLRSALPCQRVWVDSLSDAPVLLGPCSVVVQPAVEQAVWRWRASTTGPGAICKDPWKRVDFGYAWNKGRIGKQKGEALQLENLFQRSWKDPDLKSGESVSQLISWVTWDKLFSLSGP